MRRSATTAWSAGSTPRASGQRRTGPTVGVVRGGDPEFERARRYGFDTGEFDRVMRGYRSSSQADFDASDTVQDVDYISRYVDHFLIGTPIPDAEPRSGSTATIYDEIDRQGRQPQRSRRCSTPAQCTCSSSPPTRSPTCPLARSVIAEITALPTPSTLSDRDATAAGATEADDRARASEEKSSSSSQATTHSSPADDVDVRQRCAGRARTRRRSPTTTSTSRPQVRVACRSSTSRRTRSAQRVDVVTSSGIGELDPVQLDTRAVGRADRAVPIDRTDERGLHRSRRPPTTSSCSSQLVNLYMSASPGSTRPGSTPRSSRCSRMSTIRPATQISPNTLAYSDARYGAEPRSV